MSFDIKAWNKQYHLEHKDEINARKREYRKIRDVCECGITYARASKARHLSARPHLKAMKEKELKDLENELENMIVTKKKVVEIVFEDECEDPDVEDMKTLLQSLPPERG